MSIKKCLFLLAVLIIFTGCATTKSRPEWISILPQEEGFILTKGIGEASTEEEAHAKAKEDAKKRLSQKVFYNITFYGKGETIVKDAITLMGEDDFIEGIREDEKYYYYEVNTNQNTKNYMVWNVIKITDVDFNEKCSKCESLYRGEILLENSAGYNHKDKNTFNLKIPPDWINKKDNSDSDYLHFIGYGSAEDYSTAHQNAYSDAIRQLGVYIGSNVQSNRKKEDTYVLYENEDGTTFESLESMETNIEIKSDVPIFGEKEIKYFYAKYKKPNEIGVDSYYYEFWVEIINSNEDIKKSREIVEKKLDLTQIEEEKFAEIKKDVHHYIELLEVIDLEQNESEYKISFDALMRQSVNLENLSTFKELDIADSKKIEYDNLITEINKAKELYDYSDIQKQKYASVIRQLNRELEELKIEIERLDKENEELNFSKDEVIKLKENRIRELENEISILQNRISTTTEVVESYTSKLQKEIADLQRNGMSNL